MNEGPFEKQCVTAWMKNQVYEEKGHVCHLCGDEIPFELKYPDPMSRSIDHITPRSKEGSHRFSNLAPAHLVCNENRGNQNLVEFRNNFVRTRVGEDLFLKIIQDQLIVRIGLKFFKPISNNFSILEYDEIHKIEKKDAMISFLKSLPRLLLYVSCIPLIIFVVFKLGLLNIPLALVFWIGSSKTRERKRYISRKNNRRRSRFHHETPVRGRAEQYLFTSINDWEEIKERPLDFVDVTAPAFQKP